MIDTEQLAKIAYKAKHPGGEYIWEDALDSTKKIAIYQNPY